MHRILTFFLGLHWMVHFGLLAIWFIGASNDPLLPTYDWFGAGRADLAGWRLAMALGFGLAAVLFLWMLVTAMLDRREKEEVDDVARLAFAAATGILTLTLVAGATQPAMGLMPAVSLQLGALLISYVAVCAERRSSAGRATGEDHAEAGPSTMALGAVHNAMLSRFSARPGAEG